MRRGMVGVVVGILAAVVAGTAPEEARSAGGPAASVIPPNGVESLDGADRYVTLSADRGTVVARISERSGEVARYRYLSEPLNVPGVAFDGSATGLSADKRTLVLAQPFVLGQSSTELAVLDAQRLRVRDRITLRGSFSVDAISPDGRTLYLTEYVSRRDPTRYSVRAYDLDRGRLLPRPIVDPDESGQEMYGIPMTRETSPDGRWAYTLYNGSKENFVHALDTSRGTATCIDLEAIPSREIRRLDLDASPDGDIVALTLDGEPRATIDTKTFDVTYAKASGGSADQSDEDGSGGAGLAWVLIGSGAFALSATLILVRRRAAAEG